MIRKHLARYSSQTSVDKAIAQRLCLLPVVGLSLPFLLHGASVSWGTEYISELLSCTFTDVPAISQLSVPLYINVHRQ